MPLRTNGEKFNCESKVMSLCPHTKNIVLVGRNAETKKAILINPPCKQWTCEVCQEENREQWVHQAMRGTMKLQEAGYTMQFVTLTSRGYATPQKSLYFFAQNWPKLSRRCAYHTNKSNPKSWAFLMIPERHKSGVLHVHMIARSDLAERWYKDNAYQTGFGFQAEVKPLENVAQAANYVSKYLGKDVVHTGWPNGFRRVRTSRNWPKSKELKPPGWIWEPHNDESAWFEYYLLQDYGYEVIDKRRKDGE